MPEILLGASYAGGICICIYASMHAQAEGIERNTAFESTAKYTIMERACSSAA
jgi:hypothetical protein